ncbi:MAG: hypothetical protein J7M16_13615 [Anaerolineae bacterium]|nr:hypothetical protein [Anaerolineae bacterium]
MRGMRGMRGRGPMRPLFRPRFRPLIRPRRLWWGGWWPMGLGLFLVLVFPAFAFIAMLALTFIRLLGG